MSLTSVDLPEPDTPVTATKRAERELDVDVLEVVLRAPRGPRASPRATCAGPSGTGMTLRPDRYWPVSEAFDRSRPFTGPA